MYGQTVTSFGKIGRVDLGKKRPVPSRGGRGGFRVTKTSGACFGRFWSRFTQYVTHTDCEFSLWLSLSLVSAGSSKLPLVLCTSSPPRVPFKQFQDAQECRFAGIRDLTVCRYTSLGWYRIRVNAALVSESIPESFNNARAWSE